MIFFRIALTALAVAMIFFGFIVMIAPTPFGFILVILGFLLLASVSPATVRGMRKHWRWFDRKLTALEKRSPRWVAKILKRTKPDRAGADERDRQRSEETAKG